MMTGSSSMAVIPSGEHQITQRCECGAVAEALLLAQWGGADPAKVADILGAWKTEGAAVVVEAAQSLGLRLLKRGRVIDD